MTRDATTLTPYPPLPDDEIHVWLVRLDLPETTRQQLWLTLDAGERERAARFHFEHDRHRYVSAHGALRTILAGYLDAKPAALRFTHNPYGKPALEQPGRLVFNLSHSRDLALCAVARHGVIGVDIEYMRPELAAEQIAERFFSRREVEALNALPHTERLQGFFNCWTRKEAYIKARGEGLSLPLDQFDVSLAPGAPAALLHTSEDPAEAARWSLWSFEPEREYVAAVAATGQGQHLRSWRWPLRQE